jgi:hypothetical protein
VRIISRRPTQFMLLFAISTEMEEVSFFACAETMDFTFLAALLAMSQETDSF